MLWSMVSKAADRSRRQRHDNFCDPMALMIMDIQQSCFSGVMLAVGRLVRIVKTIGDKVSSKSRFYNTFDYFGYERQVGDWPIVGKLIFV